MQSPVQMYVIPTFRNFKATSANKVASCVSFIRMQLVSSALLQAQPAHTHRQVRVQLCRIGLVSSLGAEFLSRPEEAACVSCC